MALGSQSRQKQIKGEASAAYDGKRPEACGFCLYADWQTAQETSTAAGRIPPVGPQRVGKGGGWMDGSPGEISSVQPDSKETSSL